MNSIFFAAKRSIFCSLTRINRGTGQFAIVMTLLENDDITQAEIGAKVDIPGYATIRIIDVLERKGILERQKYATSRRGFSIRLTDKGKSLAPALFSIIAAVNEKSLMPLAENEVSLLVKLLTKMVVKPKVKVLYR